MPQRHLHFSIPGLYYNVRAATGAAPTKSVRTMYLKNQKLYLRLADDLNSLELGNDVVSFVADEPFLFRWSDRPVNLATYADHTIEQSAQCVKIHFSNLRFDARFPGNSYRRPEQPPDFRLTVTLSLEEEDLVVRISSLANWCEPEVKVAIAQDFFRFDSAEPGQLVLPLAYGERFDFPRSDYLCRTLLPLREWSLPMHARFGKKGGIGLWCDDPDREMVLEINASRHGTSSLTLFELFDELANEEREMRFTLFRPGDDFRALAGSIRKRLQAAGRWKSLAEKMKENPEVRHLPATVFWKHNVFFDRRPEQVSQSYSLYTARPDWNENEGLPGNWTADEIFGTAKANGFERVLVCNTGWNHAGFDAGYPTRLPVNPERGTAGEFQAAARRAKAISPGYILSCHDNYIDAYPGPEYHEEEMYQPLRGTPLAGSIWRGGYAHFMSSEFALKYARRDLPRIAELTGRGGIYLDVTAGVPLFQSRTPGHLLTRRDDLRYRRELFRLAKQCFGALAVEGCGMSAFADIVDIGGYGQLHYLGILPQTFPLPVVVPLWQMVYHDSVLNFFGEGYALVHGSEYRLFQGLFTLLPANFDAQGKRLVSELGQTYTARMTDFIELEPLAVTRGEDGAFETRGVACAVFEHGVSVIANFNRAPFVYDQNEIPARDYVVLRR